jgi:hypothetical protein
MDLRVSKPQIQMVLRQSDPYQLVSFRLCCLSSHNWQIILGGLSYIRRSTCAGCFEFGVVRPFSTAFLTFSFDQKKVAMAHHLRQEFALSNNSACSVIP